MQKMAINIDELCEHLGIGRSTAYNLIARPDFPSARLGKRIVIPVDALNEWLRRGGTEAKTTMSA